MTTTYQQVKAHINGLLAVGDYITIAMPSDDKELRAFRKYLSEIGTREQKRFSTKTIEGQLQIMRVDYYNHYSATNN